MAAEAQANAVTCKTVVKNIGLLLTGNLDAPIADADTVVSIDGRISFVGKAPDADMSGATTVIGPIGPSSTSAAERSHSDSTTLSATCTMSTSPGASNAGCHPSPST